LVAESVILDKNGEPTETWEISGAQWDGEYPSRFPDGWLSGMLVYTDDTPISPSDMVEELRKIRKPLNWVRAIISLIEKNITKSTFSERNKHVELFRESNQNIEENAREIRRVTADIERAKREGNVAEEEKLKVQLTRLTDERTKLNSVRRELEAEVERENEEIQKANAASTMTMMDSPKYTGTDSPKYTGMDESPRAGSEATLRRAVESFNSKMLDEYAKSPENFPTTSPSGSTPSSPKYGSVWDGGSGNASASRTNRFIPQIPLSILENHISDKYGNNSASMDSGARAFQMQMGGGQYMNPSMQNGGQMQMQMPMMAAPTMNVPLIATMPMTTMIQNPLSSANMTGGNAGAFNSSGVNNASGGITTTNQTGTSSNNEPNAAGVKTLSIKI
jgi:hypothetical protein